jgi:hypothetical protein
MRPKSDSSLCFQFQDATAWFSNLVLLPRAIVFSAVVSTCHIQMVKLRRAAEDKELGGHFCHAARLSYSSHNDNILLTSFTSN